VIRAQVAVRRGRRALDERGRARGVFAVGHAGRQEARRPRRRERDEKPRAIRAGEDGRAKGFAPVDEDRRRRAALRTVHAAIVDDEPTPRGASPARRGVVQRPRECDQCDNHARAERRSQGPGRYRDGDRAHDERGLDRNRPPAGPCENAWAQRQPEQLGPTSWVGHHLRLSSIARAAWRRVTQTHTGRHCLRCAASGVGELG
jgi:hypothetical protein